MEKKTIIWIAVAVIIIIAAIIYFRSRKSTPTSVTVINPVTGTTTTTTTSPEIKYMGTDWTKWVGGDYLKALAPVVNIYASKSAAQSNIVKTISSGNRIGVFGGMSGNYAIVKYIDQVNGSFVTKTGYVLVLQSLGSPANVTNQI